MQTLATLPHDLYPLVFRGLTKRDLVVLSKVNRTLRQITLRYLYEPYFGRVNPSFIPDTTALYSLLQVAGKDPFNFKGVVIESLKNTPFGKVQETYNRRIALLEHTWPQSILQLKALQLGFYWTDRALTEYQKDGGIREKEVTTHGKPLHERCEGLFATIGGFCMEKKSYEVVALHSYRDERYPSNPEFGSKTNGKAIIEIYEAKSKQSKFPQLIRRCFDILFARPIYMSYSSGVRYSSESTGGHRDTLVSNNVPRIEITNRLRYANSPTNSNDFDLFLDRKVFQIANEILLHNGFRSKALEETWSTIIAREPILKPGAGVLPEFWAIPPNIIKG